MGVELLVLEGFEFAAWAAAIVLVAVGVLKRRKCPCREAVAAFALFAAVSGADFFGMLAAAPNTKFPNCSNTPRPSLPRSCSLMPFSWSRNNRSEVYVCRGK